MIIKIFIIDYFVLQTFQNCLCDIPKLSINTMWNLLLSVGKISLLFARFCLHAEHKLHSKFDFVGKAFDAITACSYFLPELPSIPPPHKPIQIFHYDKTQRHRGKWWYKQRTWIHHLDCGSGRHQRCRQQFNHWRARGSKTKDSPEPKPEAEPNKYCPRSWMLGLDWVYFSSMHSKSHNVLSKFSCRIFGFWSWLARLRCRIDTTHSSHFILIANADNHSMEKSRSGDHVRSIKSSIMSSFPSHFSNFTSPRQIQVFLSGKSRSGEDVVVGKTTKLLGYALTGLTLLLDSGANLNLIGNSRLLKDI